MYELCVNKKKWVPCHEEDIIEVYRVSQRLSKYRRCRVDIYNKSDKGTIVDTYIDGRMTVGSL